MFLDDLEEVKRGDKKHYFGSIVYINDGDRSIIIDGQQRATTVLLMITAIYHLALESPEKIELVAEQIKDEYLYNRYAKQYGSEENRIKLRAVTTDNKIFEKIFSQAELTEYEKKSNLCKSYLQFYEYFRDRDHLEQYINTLDDFEIVTIVLDKDDDNPQKVFESINSTGKPLTDGDKIRNFSLMLYTSEKQDYVLTNYWQHIETYLTDPQRDDITDFFRVYLIAKNQSVVNTDKVYPEFKKAFSNNISDDQSYESLDTFYGEILRILKYYRFLKFGIDVNNEFTKLNSAAFIMRYLRIEAFFPYVVSVMKYWQDGHLSDDEIAEVFDVLRVYFSRRIVVNLSTASLDNYFAGLHRNILSSVEQNNAVYIEVLKYTMLSRSGQTRLPRNNEIETAIKANFTYNQRSSNVMYLLTAVDDESKDVSLLKQINNKELHLTIEHIMPQTMTNAWRDELGDYADEIHGTYLHGLANLTLTGYNSEYSNKSFREKRDMPDGFADSPLKINKTVAKYDTWNEAAILERQRWWIDKIIKIWPLPTSTFEPPVLDTKVNIFDDVDFKGTMVKMFYIGDDSYPVTSWSQILGVYCEYLYDENPDFTDQIMNSEKTKNWISNDSKRFFNSVKIHDTGLVVDVATNTNQKIRLMRELVEMFNVDKISINVELTRPIEQ
ncbi:DUF262 domain-containing protein [Candidatus Saccharibacteria bacterium oral taxon 488]